MDSSAGSAERAAPWIDPRSSTSLPGTSANTRRVESSRRTTATSNPFSSAGGGASRPRGQGQANRQQAARSGGAPALPIRIAFGLLPQSLVRSTPSYCRC